MSAARTDLDHSQSDQRELVSRDSRDQIHAKRFDGIVRAYAKSDVERLRGSFKIDYTIATLGAKRLWELLHTEPYVHALGALTGNMAVQQVRAGLKAIYLSGWQVAGDANSNGEMYPDQSLYSVDSVPKVCPAADCTLRISSDSSSEGAGMIVGMRFAIIDLPEPGGPIIARLCPPATATSTARRRAGWPFTSAKSPMDASKFGRAGNGSARGRIFSPLKNR